MLALISPAKTLDYDSDRCGPAQTQPRLLSDSASLIKTLRGYSAKRLGELMHVSDALATLNRQRFQDWDSPMPVDGTARPAILAFKGDVYRGLDCDSMTDRQLTYAQDHLRILSGLYGILRPLDLMLPYRLEMGIKLKTRRGKDLYAFWGERITHLLREDLQACGARFVLNLASAEYFRSVDVSAIGVPVIAPAFKERRGGELKMITLFAKQARGALAAWVMKKKVKTLAKLKTFSEDGYRFDPEHSTDAVPLFVRDPQ
ncbi:MAG: peroxide stress protein YaaA [Planctomycetota bacterium]